ncbi:hypothetical protein [Pseudomonas sp. PS02302]|uniref:hypothetical protein n=1 Tax=Pseudomonas sp. PS02302 TaxID=2991428 RepID=UPI00249BFD1E|nr:hypothetical protein [Pseudomonas sp. PS02302]
MANLDFGSLINLGDALWVGSEIRAEIKKGESGWRWVRRCPRLAWILAAIVDVVVWSVTLILVVGALWSLWAWLTD